MSLLALQAVAAAPEPIPTPGLMTLSLRLVASGGASIACGLLLLMWAYRRRIYISQWASAWAFASLTLWILSGADNGGGVPTTALGVAAFAAVASTTHLLAGLRRYDGVTGWQRRVGLLTATLAAFQLVPRLVSASLTFAVTVLTMSVLLGVAAWRAAAIARRSGMLGATLLAAAASVLSVLSGIAAVGVAAFPVNVSQARVMIFVNATAYFIVAFGQLLFVFEDMLLELRDTNRDLSVARTELHQAAITDELTGLNNRRLFNEVSQHHLEHHRRFHLPLSLVYLDVDRFKAVNDTLGHEVGDRVLRHVAGYVRQQVREADYVFRLGGDEFVLLISCSGDEAMRKAVELQSGFPPTLAAAGLPDTLALSVGVAEVPPDARELQSSVRQADSRMYADKRRRAADP